MTEMLSNNIPPESLKLYDKLAIRRATWEAELARPEQLPSEDEDWSTWLYLAGRGAGKTRTAAEWMAWQAIKANNTRWAVIAPTFGDVRDTCAEGESGLIPILRQYGVLDYYNRSNGEIRLLNGSRIKLFSADEPDRLRGPQHHGAWCDELAAWRHEDTFDQLQFGLRLGLHPRTVITTTPKPVPIIRKLSSREDGSVKLVRGSTFDNAKNLAPQALVELEARYHGTRLGRQELYGELLEDVEGALWSRKWIEDTRITESEVPFLRRVVVAIDPAVTSGEDSDETGIVVAGVSNNGEFYVLADYTMRATPDEWARKAVEAYRRYRADRIVAETNNGGDMIALVLKQVDRNIPVKKVVATRGKQLRAEPISALYEQYRVHHCGNFEKLEDQMVLWTPESKESPDRLDALVWALTELSGGSNALDFFSALAIFCPNCNLPAPKTAKQCPKCNTTLGEPTNDHPLIKSDT